MHLSMGCYFYFLSPISPFAVVLLCPSRCSQQHSCATALQHHKQPWETSATHMRDTHTQTHTWLCHTHTQSDTHTHGCVTLTGHSQHSGSTLRQLQHSNDGHQHSRTSEPFLCRLSVGRPTSPWAHTAVPAWLSATISTQC